MRQKDNGFVAKPGVCFAFAIVDDWSKDWLKLADESTVIDNDRRYVQATESLIRFYQLKSEKTNEDV